MNSGESATGNSLDPESHRLPEFAPAGHPPVPADKVGVLLANLGTPDGHDYLSMRRYLSEFLSDKRVIDVPTWKWQPILQAIILSKRPFSSGRAYRSIWNNELNESPLLTITREQTEKVAERLTALHGDAIIADFCMRYGNPSVESRLRGLLDQGCRRILFLPLYPQYSAATTGTANDALYRAMLKIRWQPEIRSVPAYFDRPDYVEALAQSVENAFDGEKDSGRILLVSYHGLPERFLMEGDPYHCQCRKTSRLLGERLGWGEDRIFTAFQSRFGPEEWLKPYTVEEVARLAREGVAKLAVIAPGFSADCIETLEEIEEEIRESFLEAGGQDFKYIPCLNSSDEHIDMIVRIVEDNLAGWTMPD